MKIEHSGDGVGKEAQEMWERDVGDAVGWKVLPTTLCNDYDTMVKRKMTYLSIRSDGPSS